MLHVVRASAQNDDTCRKTREMPRVTLREVSTNLYNLLWQHIMNMTISPVFRVTIIETPVYSSQKYKFFKQDWTPLTHSMDYKKKTFQNTFQITST